MATFNFGSTAEKKTALFSGFLGVDFTSGRESVSPKRSPDALNMIRDTPGKNKKRQGYSLEYAFGDEINGIHILNCKGEKKFLVHAGSKLYLKDGEAYTVIYEKMNDARSVSAVLGGRLIIMDGATMLSYDGEAVKNIKENAYVPTIIIGRSPTGGGTLYEAINMISDYRIEKFTPDGTSKKYYLSSDDIGFVSYVKKRTTSGEWVAMKYDIDYDYDEAEGVVKFETAPAKPDDGGDSILICYSKANEEYKKIINSCNICTLYGINGAMDRIFASGCEQYPNRDYYCQADDPSYWGDSWYGTIGRSDTPIVGYSLVSDYLATHKANEDSNANIILRKGQITNNEPCFPIAGTYPSSGALASLSFGTLDNEPVYLSEDGICAITPSDVLGERFSQVRSYYLNGRLLKEEGLKDASAVNYKGFYMLLLNEGVYILDGLQSVAASDEPFSHRQYEGYYWSNIKGKFLFTDGSSLYIAGRGGRLYRFCDEAEYKDDDEEFTAYWEFAEFFGDDFSRLKTFKRIDVMLDSRDSGVALEYEDENGEWAIASEADGTLKNKAISGKIHIKDAFGLKLRIRNPSGGDYKVSKIKITFINGKAIR